MMKVAEKIVSGETVTMAFLGDSVTEGCFESRPDSPEQTVVDNESVYHQRLHRLVQKAYPNSNVRTINAGHRGDSAGMGLFRMKADVLDKKPDFCCVCFGLNDTLFCLLNEETAKGAFGAMLEPMAPVIDDTALQLLREFRAEDAFSYSLTRIIHNLREASIETVLMLPNSMNQKPTTVESPELNELSHLTASLMISGAMDSMMETARLVASTARVPVVDCYADWRRMAAAGRDTDSMLCNHINHPDRESHQLFADKLFQVIFERPPR